MDKSIKQIVEEKSKEYLKRIGSHDKPDVTRFDFEEGYISGYKERDEEVKKLKELIKDLYRRLRED